MKGISKGKLLKLKGRAVDPMASARSTSKQRSTLPGTVLEAIKPANVKKVLRWGSGSPSLSSGGRIFGSGIGAAPCPWAEDAPLKA
jgi:hypothetical protein